MQTNGVLKNIIEFKITFRYNPGNHTSYEIEKIFQQQHMSSIIDYLQLSQLSFLQAD